jgi:hypothetical protein
MFCAPGLILGGIEGDRSRIRRYRGRRVLFSCFTLPDSFSAAPGVAGLFFMFCAPGIIMGGTGCDVSRFHVLRSRTHFRRFRGRRVPFSCFTLPDSFSTLLRASVPVFMFCALGLVSRGIEGVESRFIVLLARIRFWRYRGRRDPFSCFAIPDSFSTILRATGPVFYSTEVVRSYFHVLRSRTHFQRLREWRVPFSCFVLPNSFLAYRVRRVPFLCFARPHSFSAAPRASGFVYMFCSPGLIFGGTEGVWSCFHVLRSLTCFWRCGGRSLPFS